VGGFGVDFRGHLFSFGGIATEVAYWGGIGNCGALGLATATPGDKSVTPEFGDGFDPRETATSAGLSTSTN